MAAHGDERGPTSSSSTSKGSSTTSCRGSTSRGSARGCCASRCIPTEVPTRRASSSLASGSAASTSSRSWTGPTSRSCGAELRGGVPVAGASVVLRPGGPPWGASGQTRPPAVARLRRRRAVRARANRTKSALGAENVLLGLARTRSDAAIGAADAPAGGRPPASASRGACSREPNEHRRSAQKTFCSGLRGPGLTQLSAWLTCDASRGQCVSTDPASGARQARRSKSDRGDLLLVRDAERGAAAAGGDDVGVVDLEAGAVERVDVVDLRAVDVGQALAVDEDPQAVVLEDGVAVALLVEGELVLEARAAAARRRRADRRDYGFGALGRQELADLLGALLGEGDALGVVGDAVVVLIASRSIAASRCRLLDRCFAERRSSERPPGRRRRGRGLDRRRRPLPRDGRRPAVRRPEPHRAAPLVYDVFGAEIGGPIHALSLKTRESHEHERATPSATRSPRRSPTTRSSSS